jgi:putative membrane protein
VPWDHWNNWGHMGWMWILGVIVVFAIVLWFARMTGETPGTHASPEEILKQRYARGEIGKEEYEQRLSDLRK